jgi:hypothetical protein
VLFTPLLGVTKGRSASISFPVVRQPKGGISRVDLGAHGRAGDRPISRGGGAGSGDQLRSGRTRLEHRARPQNGPAAGRFQRAPALEGAVAEVGIRFAFEVESPIDPARAVRGAASSISGSNPKTSAPLPESEWSTELPMRPKPMMATSQVRMKISFPERTSTFSKKIGFDGFAE